jgi:hypothetical protein
MKLIKGNYLYVDKTQQIAELIESGEYFFISLSRRFGKYFSVILIEFNKISYANEKIFEASLLSFLDKTAAKYDIELSDIFNRKKL